MLNKAQVDNVVVIEQLACFESKFQYYIFMYFIRSEDGTALEKKKCRAPPIGYCFKYALLLYNNPTKKTFANINPAAYAKVELYTFLTLLIPN